MANTPSEENKRIDPVQTFEIRMAYFIDVLDEYLSEKSKMYSSRIKPARDLIKNNFYTATAEVSVYKRKFEFEKYDIEAKIDSEDSRFKYLKLVLGEATWTELWEEALQREILVSEPQNCAGRYLPILRGSESWKTVLGYFDDGEILKCQNSGEYSVRISNVQKVYNPFLKHIYDMSAESFAYKPISNDVNEKWLFHGTSKISPDAICLSSCGFDPRVCKEKNLIGRSIHFALHSHIPVRHYAHCHGGSEYQIILARVQLGMVSETGIKRCATRPPFLSDFEYELYDSVLASATFLATEADKATIYGIFDSRQALPEYLITFTKELLLKRPSDLFGPTPSLGSSSGGSGPSSGGPSLGRSSSLFGRFEPLSGGSSSSGLY